VNVALDGFDLQIVKKVLCPEFVPSLFSAGEKRVDPCFLNNGLDTDGFAEFANPV